MKALQSALEKLSTIIGPESAQIIFVVILKMIEDIYGKIYRVSLEDFISEALQVFEATSSYVDNAFNSGTISLNAHTSFCN